VAEPRTTVAKITMKEVESVARLSRLTLTEAEKERMRGELDGILSYIDKLRALDTEGVPPTSHAVPMTNVMREDEPRESFSQDLMLANAPDRSGEFFRVPKIIEESPEES
jgi:aspartyl-tRNA(Asn)/glutamyl-tRNA(Gln) amidotransferase subunit C